MYAYASMRLRIYLREVGTCFVTDAKIRKFQSDKTTELSLIQSHYHFKPNLKNKNKTKFTNHKLQITNHQTQHNVIFSGKNIVSCGGNGNGLVAKLCNNMLLAVHMTGVAEAMNLGETLGMDRKVLASIINTSTGRCWASDTYNPVSAFFFWFFVCLFNFWFLYMCLNVFWFLFVCLIFGFCICV